MSQELLQKLYNACDPDVPANAGYYLDCGPARGGGALTGRFLGHLSQITGVRRDNQAESAKWSKFLFSGHVGCGKSSELRHLAEILEKTPVNGKKFYPVIVNFIEYMDDYDLGVTDLILILAAEIGNIFREKFGIELKESLISKRFQELKDFLLSDVEVARNVEISVGSVKTQVQRLKTNPTARQKIREALRPKEANLFDELNLLFTEIRVKLKQKGTFDDFVVILDDLEKVQGFEGEPRGLDSQRKLFIYNAPSLSRFVAHTIFTVPLPLVRTDGPQLVDRYDCEPFVLPMVKIFERGKPDTPYQSGIDCIHDLLLRRLTGFEQLDDVFAPEALAFLVKYSGGHVRELMRFIRNACTIAQTAPISLENAEDAIGSTVYIYGTSIPESHWEKLAALDLSQDQRIPNQNPGEDAGYAQMLRDLTVMEYINGKAGSGVFNRNVPWYAVNPIVRELESFTAARARLLAQRAAASPIVTTPSTLISPSNQ